MAKHRSHSAAFKGKVAEEFIAGETLHGLAQRRDRSRRPIRIWVGKFEAAALDDDVQSAELNPGIRDQDRSSRANGGAAGVQIELLKSALKHAPRPRSAITFVVAGREASRSAGSAS
jgi:transposase